jgi:hypothetical protein
VNVPAIGARGVISAIINISRQAGVLAPTTRVAVGCVHELIPIPILPIAIATS